MQPADFLQFSSNYLKFLFHLAAANLRFRVQFKNFAQPNDN